MTEQWRGVINGILYLVQFERVLGAVEAHHIALELVTRPFWYLTPEEEYEALVEGLRSGKELDPIIGTEHTEAEKRAFLTQVVTELDAMRPWPPLLLRALPPTRWPEFAQATPIAQIDVAWPDIEGRLHHTFDRLEGGRECFVARLASGTEVAFVWPGLDGDSGTVILALPSDLSPQRIVDEIVRATTLDPKTITTIGNR